MLMRNRICVLARKSMIYISVHWRNKVNIFSSCQSTSNYLEQHKLRRSFVNAEICWCKKRTSCFLREIFTWRFVGLFLIGYSIRLLLFLSSHLILVYVLWLMKGMDPTWAVNNNTNTPPKLLLIITDSLFLNSALDTWRFTC